MKKFVAFSVMTLACASLQWMPRARTAANDEAEIRQLLDRGAKAFRARDLAKTDDEAAIRALEDQRATAARARDIEGVMAVYAPDVFVFDFIPPRQKVGAKAYRENWTSFFVTPLTYEVKDLSVTVVGDVAYSHWINHYGATYDGKPLEGNNRVTDVYRKTKGKWLIVQEHVSVPVDLDSGKADLASKP